MHEHAGQIPMMEEVPNQIHHLGMLDGIDLKMLAGRRRAGEHKDTRAYDGPDPQRCNRPQAKMRNEHALGLFDQFVDGLLGKELAGQKASFDSIDIGLPDER